MARGAMASRTKWSVLAVALVAAQAPAQTPDRFPILERDRFPASNAGARLDPERRLQRVTPPSPFGILTSRRWAHGLPYRRESLRAVPNPHPSPEPQPRRDHPYDLVVHPDGSRVYVGLQGNEALPGSELAVYDLERDAVVRRIRLRPAGESGEPGSSPFRLAMHPDGRHLLVSNRFSNFLSVVDTRVDEVVSEIPVDFYCQGITFDRDGRTAYVTNRYLDQVFVVDFERAADGGLRGAMRVLGGLDQQVFTERVHPLLQQHCGTARCHGEGQGDLLVGPDPLATFHSVLQHVTPGSSRDSRLLRAVVRTRYGGYADLDPKYQSHAAGVVVFQRPHEDPHYQRIAQWIDRGGPGPGIPVGNPRSKPRASALSSDGRWLFVGNSGTQDVGIVDLRSGREVGGIYLQNGVNDLKIYRDEARGRDFLLVTTLGIGFGTVKERAPYTGESWDRDNAGAHFSLWRDTQTMKKLPRAQQMVLGPFDAVDGTAEIKFRDLQNDLLIVDVEALDLPSRKPADRLEHLLLANEYEVHRTWVRYTSDSAEATAGDIKGDIPPELMRVVGAFPEKMAIVGDQLFVTMLCSDQVQQWRIDPGAADPCDHLVPVALFPTGHQPIGIAAGPPGTVAAGRLFVANFLGGSISILDPVAGTSREVVVDPSVLSLPVPATNAERGEMLSHTALFSSDQDTSCFHCHTGDLGDSRAWGISQVLGQEFHGKDDEAGTLIIGGTMGVPQMRNLFGIQPFFFEGVISVYEPRSMIMEHCPADDFARPTPHGDFTPIGAHYVVEGVDDVQSKMETAVDYDAANEERRDEMFRQMSMRLFGKAFKLRDFQRFVGEWQAHEVRLLPNPFDQDNPAVVRGRLLFEDPQVGCISCHPPPHFAKKDFPGLKNQAMPARVTFTVRDGSFTLMGKNREDLVNGFRRDIEPWDLGRAEDQQGLFTVFPLRGLWDRPPVFLHNGMARTLREVVASPGHPSLGLFKYEPRIGGVPERPGRREVGCNFTLVASTREPRQVQLHLQAGARIGFDTHGGTSG
ncbi:MAG: hypothetical protein FJ265_17275, partial [Planctomycetes bacterium]|nr:hypothetical protein [Planctomycetota bacterium]